MFYLKPMQKRSLFFLAILVFLNSLVSAAGDQKIKGCLPKNFAKAKVVRDVLETEKLELAIELPMRNQKLWISILKTSKIPKVQDSTTT